MVATPRNVRTVIFDKVTGYTAAQTATAALLQRSRTGVGEYLPISMLKSALYYQWPDVMWARIFQGEGVQHAGELADYFQVYSARDGHVSIVLVADEAVRILCEAVGSELHLDERYATFPGRLQHAEVFKQQLDDAISNHDVDYICDALDAHNIPVARINTNESVFDDPQVKDQNGIVEVNHPIGGAMKLADTPFKFAGQPALAERPAATLGEHSEEILRELGADEALIQRMLEREATNRELMRGFQLSEAK